MSKLFIIMFLLFFLVINTSNVASEELISKTKMQIEVQCPPYSDNAYVTRYFYISNNDLDKSLNFNTLSKRYLFAVSKGLNPILISSYDNYGNIYQENFTELGDLKLIDYLFPPHDIKIKPRDEFLITTKYKATTGIIFDERNIKKLKFGTGTIGDRELDEFKIIIPDCFGFKREFINANPKPTSKDIIDNNLILSYDKPMLHYISNISSDINTSNIYDPSVRFSYHFDLIGLIKVIMTLFGLILSWKLKNRLADRPSLRTDIYSPLYEEIRLMRNNVLDFENCYSARPRPSTNSANVRNFLLKNGQYKLIPEKLRKDIDSYYERCEEYNKQLKSVNEEIHNIFTEEMGKIKTKKLHNKFFQDNKGKTWRYDEARKKRICNVFGQILDLKFLINGELMNPVPQLNDKCNHLTISMHSNRWDNTITIDDLNRNSLSLKDLFENLIDLVGQKTVVVKFRKLQNKLKNPENILKKIEKRIHNPNPFIEKLGI